MNVKRISRTIKKSRWTGAIVDAGVGTQCNGKHVVQGQSRCHRTYKCVCRHMAYFTYTTGSGFMPNEFVAACGGLWLPVLKENLCIRLFVDAGRNMAQGAK